MALLPLVECPTISEHNLQAKLNLARNAYNARDRAHGCARKDRRIGQIELRGIKDVEELGPELNFDLLGNWEVFEQREVEVHAAWPIQDVASRIAILKLRWLNECRRIEPAAGSRIVYLAVSYSIRPAASVHCRTCESRRERQAGFEAWQFR